MIYIYTYNIYNIYVYINKILRESNYYSLKSAQYKIVIILWEEDDPKNFYLVLKVSCRRTDNFQPGTTIIKNLIYNIMVS